MKITQFLKYAIAIAITIIAVACGSDEQTIETFPIVTSASPSAAPIGSLVTVTGSRLESLDSVKLGKIKLVLLSNTSKGFTFNIPSNAVTGNIYIYKGKSIDSSETLSIRAPITRGLSPSNAKIDDKVIVGGSFLNDLDSVKVGSIIIDTLQSNEGGFAFKVTPSMFSGKVYIYKGAYVDSSLYLSVIEPSGVVNSNTMSLAINGKPFTGRAYLNDRNDTTLKIIGIPVGNLTEITLPTSVSNNQIYNASETILFKYLHSDFFQEIIFTANGLNGTTGTFTVTEIGPNKSYIRGTFSFIGKSENRVVKKITNGRLAIAL